MAPGGVGRKAPLSMTYGCAGRGHRREPGAGGPAASRPLPRPGRPLPNDQEVWEERTYKINVYNFKRDRDVEVTVELSYPADQSIGNPWKLKEDISQAHTKLSVPKSVPGVSTADSDMTSGPCTYRPQTDRKPLGTIWTLAVSN